MLLTIAYLNLVESKALLAGMLVTFCIGIHVVLEIAFMWLRGLQLVAQLFGHLTASNCGAVQPLSLLCGCLAVAHQHLALQHACSTCHEGFRSLLCGT